MPMESILKLSILKKYFVNTSLGKKYLKYQNTKYCLLHKYLKYKIVLKILST